MYSLSVTRFQIQSRFLSRSGGVIMRRVFVYTRCVRTIIITSSSSTAQRQPWLPTPTFAILSPIYGLQHQSIRCHLRTTRHIDSSDILQHIIQPDVYKRQHRNPHKYNWIDVRSNKSVLKKNAS